MKQAKTTFLTALGSLAKSRKALLALATVIVTIVLLATGQIEAELALQTIAGMLAILIAAIAWEDGAEKHGQQP